MGRRVILDTNLFVDYERQVALPSALDDAELSVAAITIAEIRVGIEMSNSPARAARRTAALEMILSRIETLDYTSATALKHAQLMAQTRVQGRPRSSHDLIIAAHAAQTGRILISRDAAARFGDLPEVSWATV